MKTLHFTNAYHPTSGGIRHFYNALLHEAAHTNVNIRLVVPGPASDVEDLNGQARIYRVRAPQSPLFDRRYRLLLPTQLLGANSEIARILREEQPDLVEVCDKYSLCYLAGMLRKGWIRGVKRPVLVGLSCERMDDNVRSYLGLGHVGRTLSSLYMRRVYMPQFDVHLANSQYTAGELASQARKHPRHVHVLPMGVEADRFTPSRRTLAGRQRLVDRVGGGRQTRILVYAGRLAAEKNVGLLPAMLKQLPAQYRLVVAGTGPLAHALSKECERRSPGRAVFLSHLDRETLADLLANGDAFVHPNPREPFGIGPLEAMASGLALVAPRTGGVTTYATDQTAWLARPNADAFAASVEDAFSDSACRALKVNRALDVASRYRWETVARQFFDTYEQLVRGSTGAPFTVPSCRR